jgi:hypothetical protein
LLPVQVAPFPILVWHVPPQQKSPTMQSPSREQVVLHAFVPQTKGEQVVVVCDGQVPLPLQEAALIWVPEAHDDMRQFVDAPGYVQLAWLPAAQLPPQLEPSVE